MRLIEVQEGGVDSISTPNSNHVLQSLGFLQIIANRAGQRTATNTFILVSAGVTPVSQTKKLMCSPLRWQTKRNINIFVSLTGWLSQGQAPSQIAGMSKLKVYVPVSFLRTIPQELLDNAP